MRLREKPEQLQLGLSLMNLLDARHAVLRVQCNQKSSQVFARTPCRSALARSQRGEPKTNCKIEDPGAKLSTTSCVATRLSLTVISFLQREPMKLFLLLLCYSLCCSFQVPGCLPRRQSRCLKGMIDTKTGGLGFMPWTSSQQALLEQGVEKYRIPVTDTKSFILWRALMKNAPCLADYPFGSLED